MTGENLRICLNSLDESLANVARKLDMTPQNLDGILRTKDIKTGLIERLCKIYRKPINYFFDEEPSGVRIEGDGNQLNGAGAHGNLNGISDSVMAERVRSLEAIVAEKDERIAELKQHIADLKSQN